MIEIDPVRPRNKSTNDELLPSIDSHLHPGACALPGSYRLSLRFATTPSSPCAGQPQSFGRRNIELFLKTESMLKAVKIRSPGFVQGYDFAHQITVSAGRSASAFANLRESLVEVLVVPRVQNDFTAFDATAR